MKDLVWLPWVDSSCMGREDRTVLSGPDLQTSVDGVWNSVDYCLLETRSRDHLSERKYVAIGYIRDGLGELYFRCRVILSGELETYTIVTYDQCVEKLWEMGA